MWGKLYRPFRLFNKMTDAIIGFVDNRIRYPAAMSISILMVTYIFKHFYMPDDVQTMNIVVAVMEITAAIICGCSLGKLAVRYPCVKNIFWAIFITPLYIILSEDLPHTTIWALFLIIAGISILYYFLFGLIETCMTLRQLYPNSRELVKNIVTPLLEILTLIVSIISVLSS